MTTRKAEVAEVTGRHLKVGDTVRRAFTPPFLPGKTRPLGPMIGVIVAFFPNGGSGARKMGSARVRWASGSTATHDAHMLVKVDP